MGISIDSEGEQEHEHQVAEKIQLFLVVLVKSLCCQVTKVHENQGSRHKPAERGNRERVASFLLSMHFSWLWEAIIYRKKGAYTHVHTCTRTHRS
jgi:hypothetical protein